MGMATAGMETAAAAGAGNTSKAVVNSGALQRLLSAFELGVVDQYLRSEPAVQEVDPYDPVKVIVGSTLHDYVSKRETDIFLNFYAPWCGHCKRLQPVWKETAQRLVGNEKIVQLAKIDATANEIPDVQVHGYPTVLLFPKNSGGFRGYEYSGPRTSDAILEWLKQHCTGTITPDQKTAESGGSSGPTNSSGPTGPGATRGPRKLEGGATVASVSGGEDRVASEAERSSEAARKVKRRYDAGMGHSEEM